MYMFLADKMDMRRKCHKGGGGGGYDVNEISASTSAQWETWAKDWDRFIAKYEPRIDFATNEYLLKDPKNEIQGASNVAINSAIKPENILANAGGKNSAFVKNAGNVGAASGAAAVNAAEKSKDYMTNNLNTVLSQLRGQDTGTIQALNPIVQQQNQEAQQGALLEFSRGQANSTLQGSAVPAIGAAVISPLDAQYKRDYAANAKNK